VLLCGCAPTVQVGAPDRPFLSTTQPIIVVEKVQDGNAPMIVVPVTVKGEPNAPLVSVPVTIRVGDGNAPLAVVNVNVSAPVAAGLDIPPWWGYVGAGGIILAVIAYIVGKSRGRKKERERHQ
jgi:hypothetical protein